MKDADACVAPTFWQEFDEYVRLARHARWEARNVVSLLHRAELEKKADQLEEQAHDRLADAKTRLAVPESTHPDLQEVALLK
jgi:hypothetical protein